MRSPLIRCCRPAKQSAADHTSLVVVVVVVVVFFFFFFGFSGRALVHR